MKNKIKELLLDTLEKYWLVIFGYHIKKSFWGVCFLILGLILIIFHSLLLGVIISFWAPYWYFFLSTVIFIHITNHIVNCGIKWKNMIL